MDVKSYEVFAPLNEKSKPLNPDGSLTIEGVASTTSRDQAGETVAPEVIESLSEQAVGLSLFIDHDHAFNRVAGVIKSAKAVDSQLIITADVLPEFAGSVKEKLDFGMNFGFSIAGLPVFDSRKHGLITGYDLKEISITSMPANWDTYGTIQVKSVVKSTNFADAFNYGGESMDEKSIAEVETESPSPVSVEDVIDLINTAFAEKEKEIEDMISNKVEEQIQKIKDQTPDESETPAADAAPKEKSCESSTQEEEELSEKDAEPESEKEEEPVSEKNAETDLNEKSLDDLADRIMERMDGAMHISKFQEYMNRKSAEKKSTFLNSAERDMFGRNKKYL